MPLIKDLIPVPERVHQGDFVLKLAEGVSHAEATLRDYVVTPQLAKAFDEALGFIQQALTSGQSKAAYLHGSFGAGKSHFMAVLNLLLAGHVQARALPALADPVARHGWMQGRKFLMVPYHMVGAVDMESAVFGQYAEHVRRLHPQAPVPGFYQAEGLFHDASELRARIGDAAFFKGLNDKRGGGGDGWGKLEDGWTASSFEAAMLEPPAGAERARLVGDLIRGYFSAYHSLATGGESFVPMDEGLAIMSQHARGLGYDAVILFLDELVLWLSSHAADVNFVSREGTKLVKLVEATRLDRPVPLVSFIARQRDLRDLVGESLPGALGAQFTDVLRHWEARFHRITLEDRNLPAIAEKRLLRAKDEPARRQIDRAFEETLRLRADVLQTLLTTDADREMFRKVYPFSPALVQTLIAVSAALQRERTALKLMLQLLVDRRDDLELGQLIPVGDLWDAIAEGDEPFSEAMRVHFDNARRLYGQRLLPMLERQHNTTWDAMRLGQADAAAARGLRNDARLLKTLLLAALVPEVESLKGLTAQRLAALNHGTFRSPIPGQEASLVLRRLRDWAGEVGEIKITDDQNPVISIQITGVDLEPVLRAAESNDNTGNRRKLIRDLLFDQFGITDRDGMFIRHEFTWRGTRREVEVLYENVHELPDERLRGRGDDWTLIIDYPFDEGGRTPNDDLARLGTYKGGSTRTLVWLPSFLSDKALAGLRRLVILDHILQGERFEQYASHLSYVDRVQARALASNQRDSLRSALRSQLEVAYGISSEPRDAVSHALAPDQQLRCLDETLAVRPPVGADLGSALVDLLDQAYSYQYPAHPKFDIEIRPGVARKVWAEVAQALQAPDGRSHLADLATRKLVRAVVPACRLGQTSENSLVLDTHWQTHFARCMAREDVAAPSVRQLRQWIDQPQAMGLPLELQNLIILTFATQTNRKLTLNGGPCEGDVDRLPDAAELCEQALPGEAAWSTAHERAGKLFGLVSPTMLNAANVAKLVADVRKAVNERRAAARQLVEAVREKVAGYGRGQSSDRQRTAESAHALLAQLANAGDDELVEALAGAMLETSDAAVARVLARAQGMAGALAQIRWSVFDGLRAQRSEAAQALLARLADALGHDEHVVPLAECLASLEAEGLALLTTQSAAAAAATPGAATPPLANRPAAGKSRVMVEENSRSALPSAEAVTLLDQIKARLQQDGAAELSLSWRIERPERD